ncbi:MAG: T9SS type A sorting domain-containing protein [Flavobacteriales bacterium]|nr:T9SS type A sorting domain-containing protein [Flavobacteriales bacterium]
MYDPPNTPCDAFIASFGIPLELITGVHSPIEQPSSLPLRVWSLSGGSTWLLGLPDQDNWKVQVYDPAGRLIQENRTTDPLYDLDLKDYASGIYVVQVSSSKGVRLHAKIQKP